jgi:hypothetical protein
VDEARSTPIPPWATLSVLVTLPPPLIEPGEAPSAGPDAHALEIIFDINALLLAAAR